ncbi:MAG: response regulator [Bryobacterales bacterium]|nr:response regulator [Bryobacterales bacterium]
MRPISVDDGLSQSHVTAIVQDHMGYVWVGTAVGLNRYDGHLFRTYTHSSEKPGSLSGDGIYSLHIDGKHRLWVGTDQGLDLYEPKTDSFRHFPKVGGPRAPRIRTLDSDSAGNVWASMWARGAGNWVVARLSPETGEIQRFSFSRVVNGEVVALHALDARRVLVVVRKLEASLPGAGLTVVLLNPETGSWVEFSCRNPEAIPSVVGERDVSLAWSGPNWIWIGAPGSHIFRVDLENEELVPTAYAPDPKAGSRPGLVSHVVAGPNGEVWVLPTYSALVRRTGANAIYTLRNDGEPPRRSSLRPAGVCDLGRSFVISSMIDQTGVLWAGLSGAGMCVADLESGMFAHFNEETPLTPLSSNFVRAIAKSADGRVWVGTRAGLNVIDRARGQVRAIRAERGRPGSLSDDEITSLLVSRDGTLWVGTKLGGLNRGTGREGEFEHFLPDSRNPSSLGAPHVNALVEDRDGVLWVATQRGGLNRFDRTHRTFSSYRQDTDAPGSIPSNMVTSILEDSQSRFWVGTEDGGLCQFDRVTGRFTSVNAVNSRAAFILSLAEDPVHPGVIWVGTLRNGLARYEPSSGNITWFDSQHWILPGETVYAVLSDGETSIWAGTNRGLARIDARSQVIRRFGIDQGLQSMEFNTRASFRAADGELFLGGVGGLNAFYPRDITQNSSPGKVLVTRVRTLNRTGGRQANPYQEVYRSGGSASVGELGAENRDLVFDFAAMHFADPQRNLYRIKLDGFDPEWRDVGATREATYTNLSPGDYRFHVKAVTSRGVVSPEEATYSFTIARPLYQRPWFILAGVLLALSAAYGQHRRRLQNLRNAKRQLETEVAERTGELSSAMAVIEKQTQQLRESDALKSRFITNVSHDFRTPLTLTLGTLAGIREGVYGPVGDGIVDELDIVIRNERRLLRLVNQLNDIARLESGRLRLQVAEWDLAAIAQDVTLTLEAVARPKQISLRFEGAGNAPVYCDSDWMAQVVANLLLNSIRFTPTGGVVTVAVGSEAGAGRVWLSVCDNGSGIPAEALPHIFDRFYQVEGPDNTTNSGLGVGLSLVKEIVDLHCGDIQVQSVPGAGTEFRVYLQMGSTHFAPGQLIEHPSERWSGPDLELLVSDLVSEQAEAEVAVTGDRPLLVIAEDNRDLRRYLVKQLQSAYRVIAAESGNEALALVRAENPDLVIADIMMPGLDGLALCGEIRKAPETDFIPVILLTAKTTMADKLAGLAAAADDYVAKPFEMDELHSRIRNLLDTRKRLRTRIGSELALNSAVAQETVPDSADALFVRRLYDGIRKHAQDQEFSIEQLAKEMAMSRMHLYRRAQTILGKSPTEILMEYRLERSAELLAARSGTVSEIAYGLGFKSVSHFTRRFRERFGRTPSDHRARSEQTSANQPV